MENSFPDGTLRPITSSVKEIRLPPLKLIKLHKDKVKDGNLYDVIRINLDSKDSDSEESVKSEVAWPNPEMRKSIHQMEQLMAQMMNAREEKAATVENIKDAETRAKDVKAYSRQPSKKPYNYYTRHRSNHSRNIYNSNFNKSGLYKNYNNPRSNSPTVEENNYLQNFNNRGNDFSSCFVRKYNTPDNIEPWLNGTPPTNLVVPSFQNPTPFAAHAILKHLPISPSNPLAENSQEGKGLLGDSPFTPPITRYPLNSKIDCFRHDQSYWNNERFNYHSNESQDHIESESQDYIPNECDYSHNHDYPSTSEFPPSRDYSQANDYHLDNNRGFYKRPNHNRGQKHLIPPHKEYYRRKGQQQANNKAAWNHKQNSSNTWENNERNIINLNRNTDAQDRNTGRFQERNKSRFQERKIGRNIGGQERKNDRFNYRKRRGRRR